MKWLLIVMAVVVAGVLVYLKLMQVCPTCMYLHENGTELILGENEFYSEIEGRKLIVNTVDVTCQKLLNMLRDSSYNIPVKVKERCAIE